MSFKDVEFLVFGVRRGAMSKMVWLRDPWNSVAGFPSFVVDMLVRRFFACCG